MREYGHSLSTFLGRGEPVLLGSGQYGPHVILLLIPWTMSFEWRIPCFDFLTDLLLFYSFLCEKIWFVGISFWAFLNITPYISIGTRLQLTVCTKTCTKSKSQLEGCCLSRYIHSVTFTMSTLFKANIYIYNKIMEEICK